MSRRYVQTKRGDIEIFSSRLKLLGLALGSLIAITYPVLFLRSPYFVVRAIGFFGAVFLAFGAAFGVYRLVVRRPVVRLTADGIFDNSSFLAAGFIPWSEIEFVAPVTVRQIRMLGFFLKDPESFARSRSWPK